MGILARNGFLSFKNHDFLTNGFHLEFSRRLSYLQTKNHRSHLEGCWKCVSPTMLFMQ